ncbi:hypothetical protein CK203_049400 [Vitis vinifera]|uniref:Retrotransposon gag domain-containing protein n=1 Tax=Vitis vinifera TaxID=29760 RepID=A0A438FVM6_VITVI|nr:hypothetical protein CK203_049400 [Vitis vinifera]
MARKIEEMELRKVHEVQAISEPQQPANPCSICQSFEHMVEECPTIPAVREMFGEQANLIGQWKPNSNAPYGNTYNSSWRNHPNFAWKPRPNPYQQKSINSQLNQKIDNVESTLNKKIDGMHNELSQKIDNIQYSISRLTNLNIVNEKGKFPSQPHQNPKGIHEVESKDEDSSKVRDVQAIITLRSGKEVHQPEHDQRKSKEDKADRKEEKKNEQKGKEVQMKESIIPSMDEEPQILLKEGTMKKHMPPPFPQALRGKKPIKMLLRFLIGLNVTKQAFLTEQVKCYNPMQVSNQIQRSGELGLGELKSTSITLSLADRSVKIPRGINYVPIILGRPFLATSNAIINCRNGVMQLTFGNMTLELNIFHLCQKHIHPEEDEDPEEVCMIDTLLNPWGMNAVMSNWRQKPVILPLFKDEEEMKEAKDEILKLD